MEDKVFGAKLGNLRFCCTQLHFNTLCKLEKMAIKLRNLDTYEVALHFADASHGNDRRKTCQQGCWVVVPKLVGMLFDLVVSCFIMFYLGAKAGQPQVPQTTQPLPEARH